MFPLQHARFVCSQCSKRAVNVFFHIQHVCTWDSGRQTCLHVVLIAAGANRRLRVQQTFNECVLARHTCMHTVPIAHSATGLFTEHQTLRKCVFSTSEGLHVVPIAHCATGLLTGPQTLGKFEFSTSESPAQCSHRTYCDLTFVLLWKASGRTIF
jgi:hypothetical protein